ncbi:MAG TPA: acetyl-CoA carboxylase biotin carboxyl carrier protein [Ignavibacteria bacterium]|nr:acetyl-CoA carboxylase biotin carboxyl carrier protein [Ignavibacteria bacterium]
MKTDLNYIKKLLKILESGEINEIEIEEEGTRVRVVKSKPQEAVQAPQMITYAAPPIQQAPQAAAPVAAAPNAPAAKTEEKKENTSASGKELIEVRSPIVGTFYRAPSPNADPYVAVGQQVSKGNILCIIEAMKLMNEIECEYEGKITKILVENAQPVEYNQVLFLVEPN